MKYYYSINNNNVQRNVMIVEKSSMFKMRNALAHDLVFG